MIDIVPAILPKQFEDIGIATRKVAGLVQRVQIDIVDGKFAPGETWPYINDDNDMFTKLVAEAKGLPDWDKLDFELDMMVEHPVEIFDKWIDAGITTVIPHIESSNDDELNAIMKGARTRGVGFGIAMLPSTSTQSLARWSHDVDFIQVMGSNTIGRQGTPLAQIAIERIVDLRGAYPDCPIAVDIGVNLETASVLIGKGVTKLVTGSTIWNSDNIAATIKALRGNS